MKTQTELSNELTKTIVIRDMERRMTSEKISDYQTRMMRMMEIAERTQSRVNQLQDALLAIRTTATKVHATFPNMPARNDVFQIMLIAADALLLERP